MTWTFAVKWGNGFGSDLSKRFPRSPSMRRAKIESTMEGRYSSAKNAFTISRRKLLVVRKRFFEQNSVNWESPLLRLSWEVFLIQCAEHFRTYPSSSSFSPVELWNMHSEWCIQLFSVQIYPSLQLSTSIFISPSPCFINTAERYQCNGMTNDYFFGHSFHVDWYWISAWSYIASFLACTF